MARARQWLMPWQWPTLAVAKAAAVEMAVVVAHAVAVVVAEERMVYRPVMIYLLIHSLIQM